MKKNLSLFVLCFVGQFAGAQSTVLKNNIFDDLSFDRNISSMTLFNDTLYVGGQFQRVGSNRTGAVMMNYQQEVQEYFPRISASDFGEFYTAVRSAVPDKNGGYFLTGQFNHIGSETRHHIARINADGTVHPFRTEAIFQNTVYDMDVYGDTLFLGIASNRGYGGKRGSFLVADTYTALPQTNMPEVDGVVYAIEPDGTGGYYLGGSFTRVGDERRINLAHINEDGSLSSWKPEANGQVNSIKLYGNSVFVGGNFNNVGGRTRIMVAAINKQTGVALPWDANIQSGSGLNCMVIDNGFLFIGGVFGSINGQVRRVLAKIQISNAAVTAWNAPYNLGKVTALCVVNSKLYVGGQFSSNAGQSYEYLSALDKNTAAVLPWVPSVPASGIMVNALLHAGNAIYVGGAFTFLGGASRSNLAALDTSTAMATPFNPVITYPGTIPGAFPVKALALLGNNLYIGGIAWQTVNSQPREGLAAVSIVTGNTTGWEPIAKGLQVHSLALFGSKLLIGGLNQNILANESMGYFIALKKNTGERIAWDPMVNGIVKTVLVKDSTLYIGGLFSDVEGQFRSGLAAFTLPGLQLKAWSPQLFQAANPGGVGSIEAIEPNGSSVYIAGFFSSVNGFPRNYLAAVDSAIGNTLNWNPNPNNAVYCLKIKDNIIYAGGSFNNIGTKTRNKIAALSLTTGVATNWYSDANGNNIYDIQALDNNIYVRGDFSIIGNANRDGFAELSNTTGDATAFNPRIMGNPIQSCIPLADKILVYGAFYAINVHDRMGLVAIQASSGKVLNWQNNTNINGAIETMTIDGTTLYVGGGFTSLGGLPRVSMASIDLLTRQVKPWTANTDGGPVYCMSVKDDIVYAGGSFNAINSIARQNAGSISKTTGTVGTWNPIANGTVKSVIPDGSLVYMGGYFSWVGPFPNVTQRNPVATNAVTGSPTSWDAGSVGVDAAYNRGIACMARIGSTLYVGGSFFNHIKNNVATETYGLAAFNTTTGNFTNFKPVSSGFPESSFSPNIQTLVPNPANKSLFIGSYRYNVMGAVSTFGISEVSTESGSSISENVFMANDGYPYPGFAAVNGFVIADNTLFAGGSFTNVDKYARKNIAAFTINTSIISLCPPLASTALTASKTGTVYQWQVDPGTGFTDLVSSVNYAGVNARTLQLINIPSAWNGYQYRCNVDGVTSNNFTLNFTNEWIGAMSSSWENAANWTCAVLPDANTNVVIKRGTVIINSNATCKSIRVDPLGTVTINAGYILTITGP